MAKSEAKHDDKACPCGGKVFATCCWPYHSGAKVADTPEKLMRARYSAYVTMDEDYLRATWHPSTRPDDEALTSPFLKWLGLEIKASSQHGEQGTVHFVARCREGGRGRRLEEISRFVFEEGLWFYVDGEFVDKRGSAAAQDHAHDYAHEHGPGHSHAHTHSHTHTHTHGGGHVHGPWCNHGHDHGHEHQHDHRHGQPHGHDHKHDHKDNNDK